MAKGNKKKKKIKPQQKGGKNIREPSVALSQVGEGVFEENKKKLTWVKKMLSCENPLTSLEKCASASDDCIIYRDINSNPPPLPTSFHGSFQ